MRFLTLLSISFVLLQLDPSVAIDQKFDKKFVQQDSEDTIEDISFIKELINAIFDGLGLNDFLGGEEACFDDLEVMLWYFYYSYDGVFESS